MRNKKIGKTTLFALAVVGILLAGFFAFQNEPASALVHEVECPNLSPCGSTQYLKIYGWCGIEETCTMYRYSWSSSPHCMVCP